ncbi:hypothetical protein, variant [Aphanomyces invadans]|uniref:Regulator of MON1-CCZ1 complex N-terminal domain-containing protein n=1 Tax=Aphanomyces invadans TaxID=157072 RepID=A0A024U0H7_9STRA|nr:hypothetical protein, variant [Aphanomyces invadans]ETV99117.1 hypothetical protein, variant [Aphanomyces invadans]|eukprot:XP_008872544.1 hypothetical protein, variant [Aphanomyces invadans]
MGTPSVDNAGGALVCLSSNATLVRSKDTSSWWHDETHDCIISLRPILDAEGSSTDKVGLFVEALPGGSLRTNPTAITASDLPHGSFSHDSTFVDVKLSIDQHFFAVQRNENEVDVWAASISSGDVGHHPIRLRYSVMAKRMSRILGLVWNAKDVDHAVSGKKTPSQYLIVVTTGGLELYKVTSTKCKFHRVVAYATHQFWWHPQHHVLVLATGAKATELRPYYVEGGNVAKVSKVVVGAPCLAPSQVVLASLYSTLYLVYAASSTKEQLLLYRIHPTLDTMCVRALRVGFDDPLCSVLDNLLVVHSATYGVTCFYDIGLPDADSFLHPLPLHLPCASSEQPWHLQRLLAPHHAMLSTAFNTAVDTDSPLIQVHGMQLNIRAIAACATASGRPMLSLLRFLLRRRGLPWTDSTERDASRVVQEALFMSFRARVSEGRLPESEFRACVNLLHHHEATDRMRKAMPLPPSKSPTAATSSHHLFLHVSQRDWLDQFWLSLQQDLPPDRFVMYLAIFLGSVRHHGLATLPALQIVYIQAMAAQGRCKDLVGCPMDDSIEVARELELQRGTAPALHQAAMDMYHRLGAVDDLVRLFVHDGHVREPDRRAHDMGVCSRARGERVCSRPWDWNSIHRA